jgi:hypothetical protein
MKRSHQEFLTTEDSQKLQMIFQVLSGAVY